MSNQAAANMIAETFTMPFDEGRFALFIRNLLNDKIDESKSFDYYGNYIPDAFNPSLTLFTVIFVFFGVKDKY